AFEDEIDLARQHPALAHQRLRAHEALERHEIRLRLAGEMDHGEDRDLVAELFLVEQRAVTLDVAGLLERPDTPQAGRRRDADPAGELHIGDSAVVLELAQDVAIDVIEAGGHGSLRGKGDANLAAEEPAKSGPERPAV